MNSREITFDHNHNGESFYEHLEDPDGLPDAIII